MMKFKRKYILPIIVPLFLLGGQVYNHFEDQRIERELLEYGEEVTREVIKYYINADDTYILYQFSINGKLVKG